MVGRGFCVRWPGLASLGVGECQGSRVFEDAAIFYGESDRSTHGAFRGCGPRHRGLDQDVLPGTSMRRPTRVECQCGFRVYPKPFGLLSRPCVDCRVQGICLHSSSASSCGVPVLRALAVLQGALRRRGPLVELLPQIGLQQEKVRGGLV
jgi:hypothetical protein